MDKLVITFTASKEIIQEKKISYLKYRLFYTEKKDFDNHFECKTPEERFEHVIKDATTAERVEMLKNIHLREVTLKLKKKKNILGIGKELLGETEHVMRDLSRHTIHDESVEFEEGTITFKVECVTSVVDKNEVEKKKASFLDKSLSVVSFGKLGDDGKEKKELRAESLD